MLCKSWIFKIHVDWTAHFSVKCRLYIFVTIHRPYFADWNVVLHGTTQDYVNVAKQTHLEVDCLAEVLCQIRCTDLYAKIMNSMALPLISLCSVADTGGWWLGCNSSRSSSENTFKSVFKNYLRFLDITDNDCLELLLRRKSNCVLN